MYFHSTLGLSSLKSLARETVSVSCCLFINIRTGSLLEELGRKCWTFSRVHDTSLLSVRSISVKLRHQMSCPSSISVQGNYCIPFNFSTYLGCRSTPTPHRNEMTIFHLQAIFFTSSEHICPAFFRGIWDFRWLFKYRKILDNLFYFIYVPSKDLVFILASRMCFSSFQAWFLLPHFSFLWHLLFLLLTLLLGRFKHSDLPPTCHLI